MTFLGKVLIVVQVVLSVCFMAFAGAVYSTQQNWRAEAEKLAQDRDTKQNQLAAAQRQLADLENAAQEALRNWNNLLPQAQVEIPTANSAAAALAHVQVQAQQVGALTRENADLKTTAANLRTQLTARETELTEKTFLADEATKEALYREAESKQLRDRVKELNERNGQLLAEVKQLNTDLFNRDVDIRTMIGKQERLIRRVGDLEQILAYNQLEDDLDAYAGKQLPPPDVRGKVLATEEGERGRSDLVRISVGHDDGLRVGHELMAYRTDGQARYLGRIRIVYTTPDQAVGAVIEKAPNGQIQKDDYVATKL